MKNILFLILSACMLAQLQSEGRATEVDAGSKLFLRDNVASLQLSLEKGSFALHIVFRNESNAVLRVPKFELPWNMAGIQVMCVSEGPGHPMLKITPRIVELDEEAIVIRPHHEVRGEIDLKSLIPELPSALEKAPAGIFVRYSALIDVSKPIGPIGGWMYIDNGGKRVSSGSSIIKRAHN